MTVRRVVPDLRADDIEVCRAFYERLGLQTVMDLGWVVTLASPSNPTAQVILQGPDPRAPVHPDLTVEVADVDALHAAMQAAGAEIVHALRDEAWGVRRFFVRDPGGRVVNVLSHR